MAVVAEPVALPHSVLADADWADCWALAVPYDGFSALEAAERMLGNPPAWVRALMSSRNRIVSPFGLRTAGLAVDSDGSVGGFPVVSERDDRVVLGFDDKHLDFRIVVDVVPVSAAASRVSVTTLVRRHNLFGRLYIAAVTPFHRIIVRSTLAGLKGGSASLTEPA